MTIEEIMEMLDIESQEDFMYFEQFAALMETEADIDYDTFAELLLLMMLNTRLWRMLMWLIMACILNMKC